MSKPEITAEDKQYILEREGIVDSFIHRIEYAKQFKLGDILIAFYTNGYGLGGEPSPHRQVTNSYGVAKKYKVIYEDKHGIPYAKELNKDGQPTGRLLTIVKWGDNRYDRGEDYIYQLDPDYEDSVLMQNEDYNPTQALNKKSNLFREIAKHNKSIMFQFKRDEDLRTDLESINKINVGDKIWKGPNSFWIILEKNPTDLRNLTWKSQHVIFKVQTHKGDIKEICYIDLNGYFYFSKPRSYKEELRDPN